MRDGRSLREGQNQKCIVQWIGEARAMFHAKVPPILDSRPFPVALPRGHYEVLSGFLQCAIISQCSSWFAMEFAVPRKVSGTLIEAPALVSGATTALMS